MLFFCLLHNFIIQRTCDALHYNELMDLHRDDYGRLVRYEEDTETSQTVQYNEFMSFTDMKHCQGKIVSCAAFHPTWSGNLLSMWAI